MKLNQTGLSLVETMIYVTIISLVVASLFSFSLTIATNRNKAFSAQEVQSNIRQVVSTINQDMRTADDVTAPSEGASQTSLVLDMGVSPSITFSLNNGIIYRTEGVGDPVAVSTDRVAITNLSFENLAGVGERDSIRLTAIVTYANSASQDFNYTQNLQAAFSIK